MYNILQKSLLFKHLTPNQIEAELSKIKYKILKYTKNDIIAFRSDECNACSIILKGTIYMEMVTETGKSFLVEKKSISDAIAPAFIYGDHNTFPVDVIAEDDVEIISISKVEFSKLFTNNHIILENFLTLLSNKVYFLSDTIWFNFSNKTISQKFLYYLFKFYNKNKNLEITIPVSINQLSDFFQVTRPSLSRAIASLIKGDLIEKIEKHKYKILNLEKIKKILEK